MVYLAVFILLCVLAYCYDYRESDRMRLFWYIVSFVVLVLVAGLRYRLGQDSIVYEREYPMAPTMWQLFSYRVTMSRYAILYLAFQSVPRSFSTDFMWMQLWHAFWVNLVFFYFIKRNTRHIFIAVLLYYLIAYLPFMMQIMRESCAVAIFLLAWPYYKKNNWLVYYLLCLAAFGFHVSAIFLFLLPIIKIKGIRKAFVFGKRTLIIGCIVLGFGFILQTTLLKSLMLFSFLDSVSERANIYGNNELGGQTLNIYGMIDFIVSSLYLIIPAMWFMNRNRMTWTEIQKKEWGQLSAMGVMFIYIALLTLSITIMIRYLNYMRFFSIIIIADWFFEPLKFKQRKINIPVGYWFAIIITIVGFQFRSMNNYVNRSGSLRTYMVYYPYASRIDQSIDYHREATIRYIHRYY